MPQLGAVAVPTTVDTTSRLGRFIVIAVSLAAFGPYVTGGLRTEQLVVYGLAVMLLPFAFPRLQIIGGMKLLLPWVGYVFTASLSVVMPARIPASWPAGNVLAGMDNILLPLAVLFLVWATVPARDAAQLLKTACATIATLMAANGALAVISTYTDMAPLLRPFWTPEQDLNSVGDRAAQLGRYAGIFNQPAEAGALYAVAALAAIYVWQHRPGRLTVVLALITLGGMISVSKVFILGGLPFVLMYWFWSQRGGGKRLRLLFGGGVILLGLLQSGFFDQWTGFNFLTRLLNPTSSALSFYSAGRYEAESNFNHVVAEVLGVSPVYGVGAAGWVTAYDGAVAEVLVVAGIIGLLMYIAVLIGLYITGREAGDPNRRMFGTLFALVIVAASLGLTPLTANRVSTIVWVLIALMVLCNRVDPRPARGRDHDVRLGSRRPG